MEFAELIKTPRADNAVLHRPFHPAVEGTLCLTGHHLIFSSRRQDNAEELWLLHSNIDSIEKRFAGSLGTIVIKCKDLRIIQLDIPGMEECLNIASSIEALSTLDSVTLMYPFFYRPMFEIEEDGWCTFLPDEEFELLSSVTDEWRLSCVNKDFSVCPSYPPVVIVPKSIDDEALQKVAMFRHGGRFPVLSYYHKKNSMVMMRSSQPLTGTNGRRCKEDEKLINATLRPGKRGYIIDTRSLNVAQQARAKGGGFEQEVCYPQWRRIHKCIDRFNILQESLIKLVEACNDQSHSMDRWLSKLEASNWLTHIKEILTAACLAAQCIDRCRTIRGFESLIVREWLQLPQKTMSLWSWVNQPEELNNFKNPLFEANSLVIWPSVAPQSLQLWEGVFLRWNRPSKFQDEAREEISKIIDYNKLLQEKVNAMRKQLAQLETRNRVQENL
ncbi:UNVERIFIED_CONTAM: hypothetical protein H355_010089 [Colinus virginianus]|nr:hypothetical protein H355_010089 [Colinus virginianus]